MNGTFKITLAYLKELGACRDGQREFQKAFPEGGGYQEVLDRCADEGRMDLARWLLDHVGPTEDVRIYEETVNDPDKNICFAGRIEFRLGAAAKRIQAGRDIQAGGDIEAGEGIQAGWGIQAGRGIQAGEGIYAGRDIEAGWGIQAGLSIQAGWGIQAGLSIQAGWGIQAGEYIHAGEGIHTSKGIHAGCGIDAGWGIEAGLSIEAGEGIQAGWGIDAGWGIHAGEYIHAGEGFGVFAGSRVKVSDWERLAVVSAKAKPQNLYGGWWKPLEEPR